jgi:predicted double-glycine peptidase
MRRCYDFSRGRRAKYAKRLNPAGKQFTVQLSQLWSPQWKVDETNADISAGRLSRTKDPLKLSKMGRGRYFIIDGNHRAQEAMMAGMTEYPAALDEFTPDMNRTGGAYRTMLEQAVPVAKTILKSNPGEDIPALPLAAAKGMKVLKGFRPTLQSKDWTCGPACVRAVLHHFGRTKAEAAIAHQAGTTKRHGTTPTAICDTLAANGVRIVPTKRANLQWCLRQLRQSRPVLLLWNDWKGHWVVLIGYDARRRVILLADPAAPKGLRVHRYRTFVANWRTRVAGQTYRRLAVACAQR